MARRYLIPLLLSAFAVLACAVPGLGQPTADPNALMTAAAATLTALAPTAAPATPTPEAPPATETLAAPTATTAPAVPGCQVVYTAAGGLHCLDTAGDNRVLAGLPEGASQLFNPRVSPDGHRIAYHAVIGEGLTELWVVGADTAALPPRRVVGTHQLSGPHEGATNFPGIFEWAGNTPTLVFETGFRPSGDVFGPGEYLNLDLWSVDISSGAVTQLLPAGSAGRFAVSPLGNFVAVVTGTSLGLVNVDGSNYRPDLLAFPSIITYSEYEYRPEPVWSPGGEYLTVMVPSADPMAEDSSGAFYRVGADGIVAPLSTVPGNFLFGGALRLAIAPEGNHAIYSQIRSPDSPGDQIFLANTDGSAQFVLDERAAPQGWGWSPSGQHFVYTSLPGEAPGTGFVTGVTPGSQQAFAPSLTAIAELDWVDNTTFVFLGRLGADDWSLYRLSLGATEPELLASGLTLGTGIDTP